MPRYFFVLLPLILLLANACTTTSRWFSSSVAPGGAVARALGDYTDEDDLYLDTPAEEIPIIPAPDAVRPCCAFGVDLRAKIGSVPVPAYKLGNMRSPDDIGNHKYASGFLTMEADLETGEFLREDNGLVYTCRGGFIDTAHVRDYADMTLFLASRIGRYLETGATVDLPHEGGKRRVVLQPVERSLIKEHGLREVTVPIAQWLAFQVSIWHEIATWYGYATIDFFPEGLSSFSPEDLYSNLLGVKLTGGIIYERGAGTETGYNRSIDAWMKGAFDRLGGLPADVGGGAMRAVDGVWWDSRVRIPDMKVVLRRNMDIGEEVRPWLVSDAYLTELMAEKLTEHCGGVVKPLVLDNPYVYRGIDFRELVTLEIEVDEKLAESFPFPRPPSRLITQDDFPAIIESIRIDADRILGRGADEPRRDL